jgi:hypothetical protein
MNPVEILEKFGIPVAVAIAFGYFIWKQNQYIQKDLSQDLKERFERLEGIIIKLIDQQKLMQIELGKITSRYNALVTIITKMIRKNNTK